DHSPENERKFKEIQKSKSEYEGSEVLIESLKDDEASNKSEPVLIQLVEYPELRPKEEVKDEAEFSGYNDPEYIKWKNEQKAKVADQLIKKKEVNQAEVSKGKVQKSKLTVNQSETKQSKGKSVITSNDNTKAQVGKTETVKPVTKKVSKIKPIKFVSAGTFGLKTGSGPKTSAVNDKRFESKKVTKQDVSKSNQVPKQSKLDNKQSKSQSKSPQKNQVNLKPNKTDNESRALATRKER
ncbi:hypothetical protein ACQ7OT_11490, partial [Micrococcus luteus]